jgi:hypothetical protein
VGGINRAKIRDYVELYSRLVQEETALLLIRLHMSKTATIEDETAKLIKYFNYYAETNKSPEYCSAEIDALFDKSVVFVTPKGLNMEVRDPRFQ